MWRGAMRLLLLSFVAALMLGVVFGAIVFALVGAYQSLATEMAAWQAGLLICGAMLVLALLLLGCMRLVSRSRRKRSRPAEAQTASADALAPPGPTGAAATGTAEVPPSPYAIAEQAGGAAARAAQSAMALASGSRIHRSDLVIGALVAGLVIGARSGRRR